MKFFIINFDESSFTLLASFLLNLITYLFTGFSTNSMKNEDS